MNLDRIRRVLNSMMIFTFLIFGALVGIIFLLDTPLTNSVAALPFAFLFISAMTLITTGQIKEKPKAAMKYVQEWLAICIFVVLIAAAVYLVS